MKIFSLSNLADDFRFAGRLVAVGALSLSRRFGLRSESDASPLSPQKELKNGALVRFHHFKDHPCTKIHVSFDTGSLYNPPGKSIAHLLEHLLIHRFEDYPYRNAHVDTHDTTYKVGLLHGDDPHQEVAACLRHIRDGLFDGSFDEAAMEREKAVLRNERTYGNNQPPQNGDDTLQHASFSFLKTVIQHDMRSEDTRATLDNTTAQDLADFMAQYYVGRNMTITITGPACSEALMSEIESLFEDIPAGTEAPYKSLEASYKPGEYISVSPASPLAHVTIGLLVPEPYKNKPVLMDMMRTYLSRATYKAMRIHKGLAYQCEVAHINAFIVEPPLEFLSFHTQVFPEFVHHIAPIYSDILSRLAAGQIDPDFLRHVQDVCIYNQANKAYRADPKDVAAIRDISAADLQNFMAATLADPQNISLQAFGPGAGNIRLHQLHDRLRPHFTDHPAPTV